MFDKQMLDQIIRKHLGGISIPIYLIMAIAGVVIFHLILEIRYKNREGKPGIVWSIPYDLLILYACFIFQVTFVNRTPGSRGSVNLTLMNLFRGNIEASDLYLQLLNVVLFLPYGFFFGWARKKDSLVRLFLFALGLSYIGSFLIEILQLVTKRGYFETMDLITNVLGGSIGAIVGWIVMRPIKNKELKEKDNGESDSN